MVALKWTCIGFLFLFSICSSLMVEASPSPPPHTESTVNDPKFHTRVDTSNKNWGGGGGGGSGDGCYFGAPDELCPPEVIGNPWVPSPCHCEPINCGSSGDCPGLTMYFTYPTQGAGASTTRIMHDDAAAAAMAPESA